MFSGTQSFYTQTEKGTLARISEDTKYIKYAPNQKHELKIKGEYEFIVNHRSTTTSDYTYLAVEVIRVFPENRVFQQGFALKRNDGWVRTSGDAVLNQNEYWNESKGLQKFRRIHEKDDRFLLMKN